MSDDRERTITAEGTTLISEERDLRGLRRCWQNNGWHVYMAGPCFETYEHAIAYRNELDSEGIQWKPQV